MSALLSHRTIAVTAGILLFVLLIAIVGPLLSPQDFQDTDLDHLYQPPTFAAMQLFGTDDLGRDLFVRTMLGVRVTLLVAVVASLVSLIIGVTYGAIAGYVGGRVDAVMMRFVDTLYALPFIFFVILLMVAFERNFLLIFVAIGAINWLDMARIVRGQTLSLRERDFVAAARLTGVSTARIIFRHIAPNLIGIVVVYVTLTIPQAILVESFLSFLGLGVQEPQTSLGALVYGGVSQMEGASWILLIPATLLALILMCFNFLGDGLRDFFDARHVCEKTAMSLLDVNELTVRYGDDVVVNKLSFSVEAAESVGIVGESGSGKSQTAMALLGLLPNSAEVNGSIRVDGTEIVGRRRIGVKSNSGVACRHCISGSYAGAKPVLAHRASAATNSPAT